MPTTISGTNGVDKIQAASVLKSNFLVYGQYFHAQDQKPQNTVGGTFSTGDWRTRDFNTVLTNEITGASLSTNQITLPAGTYYINAHCMGYGVGLHKLKLYNVSDSVDVIVGPQMHSNSTSITGTQAPLFGRFTIGSSKSFELRHYCNVSNASNGFGAAQNISGYNEVYSDVQIWRIT